MVSAVATRTLICSPGYSPTQTASLCSGMCTHLEKTMSKGSECESPFGTCMCMALGCYWMLGSRAGLACCVCVDGTETNAHQLAICHCAGKSESISIPPRCRSLLPGGRAIARWCPHEGTLETAEIPQPAHLPTSYIVHKHQVVTLWCRP